MPCYVFARNHPTSIEQYRCNSVFVSPHVELFDAVHLKISVSSDALAFEISKCRYFMYREAALRGKGTQVRSSRLVTQRHATRCRAA